MEQQVLFPGRPGLLGTIRPQGDQGRPHLNWVHAILLGGGHIEAHLHERDLCIVVLVELQRHLVLACGALGHVAEGYLEDRLVANVKGKQLPCGRRAVRPQLLPLESAQTTFPPDTSSLRTGLLCSHGTHKTGHSGP